MLASAAAAAPAAAPTTTAVTTTASATATLGPGTRFVHVQSAPVQLFAIQSCNRLGRRFVIGHLDKTKSAGPSRIAIRHNLNPDYLTEGFEQRTQVALRGLKIHITDEQTLHSGFLVIEFIAAPGCTRSQKAEPIPLIGDSEIDGVK